MNTKQCSICGKKKRIAEFDYGNRSNRSYCKECDSRDKAIYRAKGLEAVRAWRAKMRRAWQ